MGIFSVFEKKNYTAKEKKNPTLLCPGLRYAHKKLNFGSKKKLFLKMIVCVQN